MSLPAITLAPNVWDAGHYIVVVDSIGVARITTLSGDYVANGPQAGASLLNLGNLVGTL